MNFWWPLFLVLACAWVLPLWGWKQAGATWPAFFGIGCFWLVLGIFARPLYHWGTNLLRKLEWEVLAGWRERIEPRVFPAVRVALYIMGITSLAFTFL